MAAELTGLRPPRPDPEMPVCAVCGPTWNASRGFAGGIAFCAQHVPAHMRFPWEPGHAAAVEPVPIAAAPARTTAPDLFGSVPA